MSLRRSFLLLAALLAGCSSASSDEQDLFGGEAIINGSDDTTRQAVVYVDMGTGACSGTIIAKSGSRAVVMSAAHCMNDAKPQRVFVGNDISSATAEYKVTKSKYHPSYDPQSNHAYDFGVITIEGVDESTPVIPIAGATDNLKQGSPVTVVGYGKTQDTDQNTVRHYVNKSVDELTKLNLSVEQSTSGVCFGDSGGPALSKIGGVERLVGVNSYVLTDECINGAGYVARTSAVYESFIKPYIEAELGAGALDGSGDPNQGDPNQGDPNQGDPNQGDPNQGDPNQGDPNQGDPSDPGYGDPGQGDPNDPGYGDPGQGDPSDPGYGDPGQGNPNDPGYGDPGQGDPNDPGQGDPSGSSCDMCAEQSLNPGGACAAAMDACYSNQSCLQLLDCLNTCWDDSCVESCFSMSPQGAAVLGKVDECICSKACGSQCASACGGA